MSEPAASFDLLAEPWLPCVDAAGRPVELGLREAFARAHELRAVASPSPLCTFALHRLLLAVTHRVLRGPRTTAEWRALWQAGRFDVDAFSGYFDRWADRFDLFHPRWPFYQVGGFHTISGKGDKARPSPSPVTRLLPELASANNTTLFDHTTDADAAGFTPAQAARAVVVAQTWGLGGGKGPTSNHFGLHPYMPHAPCVGAIAVLVANEDLFQTLALNLARIGEHAPPPFTTGEDDKPSWERDDIGDPGERVPRGLFDFFTLQARYLRLVRPGAGARVTEMFVGSGDKVPEGCGYDNPFAFYRVSDKRGRLAVRFDPSRVLWRDSPALFGLAQDTADCRPGALRLCAERGVGRALRAAGHLDPRLLVRCYGFANDKAKPLAWGQTTIPAPARLLDDPDAIGELAAGVQAIEDVWAALDGALRTLAYAALETPDKKPDQKDVGRLQRRFLARTDFWSEVEPGFRLFLGALDPAARASWVEQAARAAQRSLSRASMFADGSTARVGRASAIAARALARSLGPLLAAVQPSPPPTSLASPAQEIP